jgi:hypothetical protein
VKTLLYVVIGYFIFTSMGTGRPSSNANTAPPPPPQPQGGAGDTATQLLAVIRSTAKVVGDAIANDRNAPSGSTSP